MNPLNVQEKSIEDNSIYSLDYFPFLPITGTQYNNPGVIQINIENQDEYFLPHKSWIEIEADLVKTDNARYVAEDTITLTNNGILNCFSNIKYHLGGNEIESLNHPGYASLMLGLLKYDRSFSGLSQCWSLDNSLTTQNNNGFNQRKGYIFNADGAGNIGKVSFAIDLEHIFGFAEDYDKVILGMRHSLQFNRKANDNDAIFRSANEHAGKVVIQKITWWMARVTPSVPQINRLRKLILEEKVILDASFRVRQCSMVSFPLNATSFTWNLGVKTEKPRYIVIALQTGKDDNQQVNASLFNHCHITNMKVITNSTECPSIDINSNFATNTITGWYKRLMDFKMSFYGVDKMVSCTGIDAKDFKDFYPLFVFDISRQKESTEISRVVDISVRMTTNVAVGANTNAFALVISDRNMQLKADGTRMVMLS